jgi:hypothetical protein
MASSASPSLPRQSPRHTSNVLIRWEWSRAIIFAALEFRKRVKLDWPYAAKVSSSANRRAGSSADNCLDINSLTILDLLVSHARERDRQRERERGTASDISRDNSAGAPPSLIKHFSGIIARMEESGLRQMPISDPPILHPPPDLPPQRHR